MLAKSVAIGALAIGLLLMPKLAGAAGEVCTIIQDGGTLVI